MYSGLTNKIYCGKQMKLYQLIAELEQLRRDGYAHATVGQPTRGACASDSDNIDKLSSIITLNCAKGERETDSYILLNF